MEHRSRKKSYIVSPPHGIVALAVILAAALLLIAGAGALMGHKKRLQTDANAVDSAMKPLTQEELRVKVQQAADTSGFWFRMNAEPTAKRSGSRETEETQAQVPAAEGETSEAQVSAAEGEISEAQVLPETEAAVVEATGPQATGPQTTGPQTADWNISNSIENNFNMEVVVTLEDGSEIYRSSTLAPGQQELTGALSQELSPGTYKAVATAYALDRASGDAVGTVSSEVTIHVES